MQKMMICVMAIIGVLALPLMVYAQDLTPDRQTSTGEYTYTCGEGTFQTNVYPGITCELAYFECSDGVNITVMKDGSPFSYEEGDFIVDNGNYLVYIYDTATETYGNLSFVIENDTDTEAVEGQETASSADSSDFQTGVDSEDGSSSQEEIEEYLDQYVNDSDDGMTSQEQMDSLAEMINMSEVFNSAESSDVQVYDMDFRYDNENKGLCYSVSSNDVLLANVPNGSVVTSGVNVTPLSKVTQYTYKDGELILTPSDHIYTEPGFYKVVSFVYSMGDEQIEFLSDEDSTDEESINDQIDDIAANYFKETEFYFTILGDTTDTNLGLFTMPQGFRFCSILFNGKETEVPDKDYYFFDQDGKYEITVEADKNSKIQFTYEYQVDRVAPFVEFNKDITQSVLKAPLVMTRKDPSSTMEVYVNGEQVDYPEGQEIYNSGYYTVKVFDKAGNERSYHFYVKEAYKIFSRGMILLIISFVVLVICYALLQRRGDYKIDE